MSTKVEKTNESQGLTHSELKALAFKNHASVEEVNGNQPGKGLFKKIRVSNLGSANFRFDGRENTGYFIVNGEPIYTLSPKGERVYNQSLNMTVIGFVAIECRDFFLFGKKFEKYPTWIEVIFISEEGWLSSMFIKQGSLLSMRNLGMALHYEGRRLQDHLITATATFKSGDLGKYYDLTFSFAKDEKDNLIPTPKPLLEEISLLYDKNSKFHWYYLNASEYENQRIPVIARETPLSDA